MKLSKINFRKGLFRLWVFFSVLWIAFSINYYKGNIEERYPWGSEFYYCTFCDEKTFREFKEFENPSLWEVVERTMFASIKKESLLYNSKWKTTLFVWYHKDDEQPLFAPPTEITNSFDEYLSTLRKESLFASLKPVLIYAVLPPVIVFLLVLFGNWVLLGFKKRKD